MPGLTQEYGQKRLKDTEFVLPVCFGTVAWWQGKKAGPCGHACMSHDHLTSRRTQATETATHKWTVYVRGPNNEDLSYVIRKVGVMGRILFSICDMRRPPTTR